MYRSHALEAHLMYYIQSDEQSKSQIADLAMERMQLYREKCNLRAARKLEQVYIIATSAQQQNVATTTLGTQKDPPMSPLNKTQAKSLNRIKRLEELQV